CLLAANALVSLRLRLLAIAAAAAAITIQIPGTAAYFALPAKDGEQWATAVAYLEAHGDASTAVVLCPNWYRGPLAYYLRRARTDAAVFGVETGPPADALPNGATTAIWPEQFAALPERFGRVILLRQTYCPLDTFSAQ